MAGGRSKIPILYEDAGKDNQEICLAVSAIRRVPNWLLYELHRDGLWDDLFSACLSVVNEKHKNKKTLYNAAQRAIYRFLRDCGYRKARVTEVVVTTTTYLNRTKVQGSHTATKTKQKSLWMPKEEVKDSEVYKR